MVTILDADMRMALWDKNITDKEIAELEKALAELAKGHEKMKSELALRVMKIVDEKGKKK